MARPREFDYDQALDRAMRLFWAKGYSNTSLRDLLRVMRIGEGSFYKAVDSKKALYLAALKRYNDIVTKRRLAALESEPTAARAVRRFFSCVLDELDDLQMPPVCLMARSLSSEVLAERDLRRYVIGELSRFERGLIDRLEAAKASGELPKKYPVEATAQLLVTYLQGLFRVVRVLHSRREIEAQLEILLGGAGL